MPRGGKPIPVEKRFWTKVAIRSPNECWLWLAAKDVHGRGIIGIQHHKTTLASRVAFHLTKGDIPAGLEVCHSCDNPSCVNPDHLFLGTHRDNMRDMSRKGRYVVPGLKGSQHPMAKLTENDVREIRRLFAKGYTKTDLAKRYNITRQMVRYIVTRQNWKHI